MLLAELASDVSTFIEFCKFAGAGGLAVALPGFWLYRKDNNKRIDDLKKELAAEREYIRQADKETLTVLGELTKVIGQVESGDTNRHAEVLRRIDEVVAHIKGHIDARFSA